MSDEEIVKLSDDLRKKLNRLGSMIDRPLMHVIEYFSDLRFRIDLDAETLIKDFEEKEEDEEEVKHVNETRDEFLRILKVLEESLLKKLSTTELSDECREKFAALKKRTEHFEKTLSREGDIGEIEEAYVKLALDLIKEKNEVERCLLGKQSIFYYSSKDHQTQLGLLIYFPDDYLSQEELSSLRQTQSFFYSDRLFTVEINMLNVLKGALLLPFRRDFVVTKNHVIMDKLTQFLRSNQGFGSRFLFFGELKEPCFGYSAEEANIALSKVDTNVFFYNDGHRFLNVDSFETNQDVLKYLSLKCYSLGFYPKTLKMLDQRFATIFENLHSLQLDYVKFGSSNLDLLGRCEKLKSLGMIKNTFPDNKYDLGFLASLIGLDQLSLTLPDSEWDFEFLGRFDKLTNLSLEPVAVPKKNKQLSKKQLIQISTAFNLKHLSLSHFEIESIDEVTMKGFRELTCLNLTKNCIAWIDEKAFSKSTPRLVSFFLSDNRMQDVQLNMFNSLSTSISIYSQRIDKLTENSLSEMKHLTSLTLSCCRIDRISAGAFDSLASLKRLNLGGNHLKVIEAGTFDKLVSLTDLSLGYNPISSIANNAFVNLRKLASINLGSCQLTSINNQMFNGLVGLTTLHLNSNQIASIEVIDEDSRLLVPFTANLTSDELANVKKLLFKDLSLLLSLHLSGNKLPKLDLNYFINLERLQSLNLDLNAISELNCRSEPELFPVLKFFQLRSNQLTSISKEAFCSASQLQTLTLYQNKLERLDAEFFTPFLNLSSLDLSENKLEMNITETTFASCRDKLSTLSLRNNPSIRFEDGALRHHTVLQNLDLSNCKMPITSDLSSNSRLWNLWVDNSQPQVLEQLVKQSNFLRNKLYSLKLNSCSIRSLSIHNESAEIAEKDQGLDTFNLRLLESMCTTLAVLDLSGNLIESLTVPNLFAGLPNLSAINLGNNRLTHIDSRSFAGLSKLNSLDLSRNRLASVDERTLRKLDSLRYINLSQNCLACLHLKHMFRSSTYLFSLNLSDNQLDNASINEASMSRLRYLTHLYLGNNRLEDMSFVRSLPRLSYLDLQNNKISSLESNGSDLLGHFKTLTSLNLSGNAIQRFREEAFDRFRDCLAFIDLSKNPLQLDSVLSELL